MLQSFIGLLMVTCNSYILKNQIVFHFAPPYFPLTEQSGNFVEILKKFIASLQNNFLNEKKKIGSSR